MIGTIGLILLGALGGIVLGYFLDDIIDWAKDIFNDLEEYVKKAWVYVKRVPGAVKQFIRYIKNGTMYERTSETLVTPERLREMRDDGDISQEEYEVLMSEYERKIAELNR